MSRPTINIHQFHSGSAVADAITNCMLFVQSILKGQGFTSEIFAEHVDPQLADAIRPLDRLAPGADDLLLIHHSMGHGALKSYYDEWPVFRILFVGRLVPHKCQHEHAEFVAATRSIGGIPLELVLVGDTGIDTLHGGQMHRIRALFTAEWQRLPISRRKKWAAEQPTVPEWKPRNDRETCVCGLPRCHIPHNIWARPDPDPVNGEYFYRCTCGTLSSVNLFFNEGSYTQVPIEAYAIPDEKWRLNRARIEWIRARIPTDFPEAATVYDLGAGEGCFTCCWHEAYPKSRLFAVETDRRMRERFAAEYAGAEYVCEPIETFLERAVCEPSADLIVLCDVLEHVLEPEALLRLIAGSLKPSGFAYITLPNVESYGRLFRRVPAAEVDWEVANWPQQHLWMMEPRILNDVINRTLTIQEMSRSFEFQLRRDSDYSTFLVQRPFTRSLWVPSAEEPLESGREGLGQ